MTPDALGDLLVGVVLAVLMPVAIGTISYGIRVVKELRPLQRTQSKDWRELRSKGLNDLRRCPKALP